MIAFGDRAISRKARSSILLVLLIALFASLEIGSHLAIGQGEYEVLTVADPPQLSASNAQTDGETVAWVVSDKFNESDVYALRLNDGVQIPVAVGPGRQGQPSVDGDLIVWREEVNCPDCNSDIYGMWLSTSEHFAVAATEAHEGLASISGDKVIWSSLTEDGFRFLARDVKSGAETETIIPLFQATYIHSFSVNGNRMVWAESSIDFGWRLYTALIEENATRELLASSPVSHGSTASDLDGDYLAYVDAQYYLRILNLETGEETIVYPSQTAQNPSIDGRYVFFLYESDGGRRDLQGYDIESRSVFRVAEAPGDEMVRQVDAAGGLVTWTQGEPDGDSTVFAAHVEDLLPTSIRCGAGYPVGCFPETGQVTFSPFASYWTDDGGIPIFGYPLTTDFKEQNSDTGEYYQTQFFERQRFELHPENDGTPYKILLGRLGDELLQAQGRDWTTFPKAEPDTPHYMPETDHAIAPEFWEFWSSHGLEFGDAGFSYRESLALFGFPLSEPMMETNSDGDAVLTQYFERAVFEHHPDNLAAYQVLLRRVGTELLVLRDWLQ